MFPQVNTFSAKIRTSQNIGRKMIDFTHKFASIATVLQNAIRANATDIILISGKTPSVRIAGNLRNLAQTPIPVEDLVAFRHALLSPEKEMIYQTSSYVDVSDTFLDQYRLRFNFYTTISGPAVAIRPIRSGNELDSQKLNLPGLLKKYASLQRGLLIFSGTTGSGKSTTMGAFLQIVNKTESRHILTLEDPVEYMFQDDKSVFSQRELDSTLPNYFANALRSAMRENPDIIVIGELRDKETMETAINAALTGHFVIATIHAFDAIHTVERIIHSFPQEKAENIAENLSTALIGIFSQRLIPSMDEKTTLYPAFEILLGTGFVKKMIAARDYDSLESALNRNIEQGMMPFKRSIFRLYRDAKVSLEHAREASSNPEEFDMLVHGVEVGNDTFRNFYGVKLDENDDQIVDMAYLFHAANQTRASDLILTAGARPVLRIDGELREIDLPTLSADDVQRLLYSVINQAQRTKLEEKRELDFALSIDLGEKTESPLRFRMNAFFQKGSLALVARTVNLDIPEYHELGIPDSIIQLLNKKQGLILVSGPTGSGKSTTLACMVQYVNESRCSHIITIEDPIEFVFKNQYSIIEQREVNEDTHSFASALKYALRETPDIIMLGEMRDTETMASALTAAETGHLVLATVHTNSAPESVDRIIDSFPHTQQNQIRAQLSDTILAVVSQRLVPRADGNGRIAVFELMKGNYAIRNLIRNGETHLIQSSMEIAKKEGMITLERAMQDLYEAGIISKSVMDMYNVKAHGDNQSKGKNYQVSFSEN